jgi:hypothetical protein
MTLPIVAGKKSYRTPENQLLAKLGGPYRLATV